MIRAVRGATGFEYYQKPGAVAYTTNIFQEVYLDAAAFGIEIDRMKHEKLFAVGQRIFFFGVAIEIAAFFIDILAFFLVSGETPKPFTIEPDTTQDAPVSEEPKDENERIDHGPNPPVKPN